MAEKEAIYKIRATPDGSNTIHCCFNSLWKMNVSYVSYLLMVSRRTPWRSLWQLQWFLCFALSMVNSPDLKIHLCWRAELNVCCLLWWRVWVGELGRGLTLQGGALHAQFCYGPLGWLWPNRFAFLQASVFSLANGVKILTSLSAFRFTHENSFPRAQKNWRVR